METFIIAALVSLPLSEADLAKFQVEVWRDPSVEGQALALNENLNAALRVFRASYGEVSLSIGPKKYKWQAEGYYIFVSVDTAEAAILLHDWLLQMDGDMEGFILPSTWKASADDEKRQPKLLEMQQY